MARECARCERVLVDEDDQGWYYQMPVTLPDAPGLTFMDRVHECYGKPHDARLRCPDRGRCHHSCASVAECFRVQCCGPLSGVYPGDVWPADVRASSLGTKEGQEN